jgi:hypothetical protein
VSRPARTPFMLLVALIAGDVLFIALHCFQSFLGTPGSELWSIEHDRGFAEMFQYLKYIGIGLALAHLARRTRLAVLLGWIGVFAFLLLDDSMRIHERFGLGMVAWVHIPDVGGLRGRDVGELIFAVLAISIVAPVLALGYVRGSSSARQISADLFVLLAVLVTCAVGGDAIHRVLSGTVINIVAGVMEDGGEMLALSFTCCYIAQWIPYHSRTEADVRFRPGLRLWALAAARPLSH